MKNNNLLKNFIKYTGLSITGQMIYSCYTMTDTFFVSIKLGADGLTALNLAFPVFCLLNGIGLMIGIGAGTGYSINKSRGKNSKANRIFTSAALLTTAFSFIFLIIGLFCSDLIVRLLGADEHIFKITHTYLFVMLMFAPAFLINNLIQCFIRNDGSPSLSSRAMITGSFANIILDYIFIFPMNLGIFGAIFATGLSPVISILVTLPYFINRYNGFSLCKMKIRKKIFIDIISGGIPQLLSEVATGIVMMLFNYILLGFSGNIGVAAFGIISVVSLAVTAVYTGLSQGIQPLMSQSYGCGEHNSLKLLMKYSLYTSCFLSVLIYSLLFIFASDIAAVFNSECINELGFLAESGMKIYFTACPFIGFNLVLASYLISTEYRLPAQIISLMRSCLVLIPVTFLLSSLFNITGVWCAYPISELITAVAGLFLLKKLFS